MGSCNAFNENVKSVWIPHNNSEWAVKGAADVFRVKKTGHSDT